jgi:hypothetical protein
MRAPIEGRDGTFGVGMVGDARGGRITTSGSEIIGGANESSRR